MSRGRGIRRTCNCPREGSREPRGFRATCAHTCARVRTFSAERAFSAQLGD